MKVSLERLTEVKSRTGLSKSSIYELLSKGKFPKPVPLSPGGRCVGWLSDEIDRYIADRIAER